MKNPLRLVITTGALALLLVGSPSLAFADDNDDVTQSGSTTETTETPVIRDLTGTINADDIATSRIQVTSCLVGL